MIQILFRKEAEEDLRSIIAYFEEVAPEAIGNILADIYRSIDQLSSFPRLGMPVPNRSCRRIVTLKYHFKIAYELASDRVHILGIFRHQDREV
ncbi:MAG: type II toxin-antitoxin system RelE/ParE family toxin [Sphingomonadaceae bacterium]|nr:type II toxin-antitoxin system RelE/ParE family toxin [Sphingomonadaceae bacterium]